MNYEALQTYYIVLYQHEVTILEVIFIGKDEYGNLLFRINLEGKDLFSYGYYRPCVTSFTFASNPLSHIRATLTNTEEEALKLSCKFAKVKYLKDKMNNKEFSKFSLQDLILLEQILED